MSVASFPVKRNDTNMFFRQVTATVRNLVESAAARRKLLSIRALPQLCTVMRLCVDDQDVCTNAARIFRWVDWENGVASQKCQCLDSRLPFIFVCVAGRDSCVCFLLHLAATVNLVAQV